MMEKKTHMPIFDTKLTKIVATLGPASEERETIAELIRAGVNVFRFNTKHGIPEWHEKRIIRVQKVADELSVPIGILLDLQGPELRIQTRNGESIEVAKDDIIEIKSTLEENGADLAIPHIAIFDILEKGDQVLIDDGYIEGEVEEGGNGSLKLRILNPGIIKDRKGINLPGKHIDLPSLIEADLKQLDMGSINKVDYVALSFSRTKNDIDVLRKEMQKRGMTSQIVAKVESQPALDNLDELIEVSDAIMVARGDLGVEVPIEELAYWQKEIILKSRLAGKPVITATQMLESMIQKPRPMRSEATDVANAVLDGTAALMLSAETAIGKYPVRAVEYMSRIAKYNENKSSLYKEILDEAPRDRTEQVVGAAVSIITNQTEKPIDGVLIFTETGYTALSFARYRLNIPVIAATDSQNTVEQMALSFGVFPFFTRFEENTFVQPEQVLDRLRDHKVVNPGQTILVIHGKHWQVPGLTNSLTILTVGEN